MIRHDAELLREWDANGWLAGKTFGRCFRENGARVPDRLALVDACNRTEFTAGAPQRLTYAQLDGLVDAFAGQLLDLGMEKDSVLVCQLPNVVELIALYLACARIGALISAIPMQYEVRDALRIVQHVRAKLIVSTPHYRDKKPLAALHDALAAILSPATAVGIGEIQDGIGFLAAQASPRQLSLLAVHEATLHVDPNEVVTLLWTSGTTGWPKCVPRSHNNWFASGGSCVDSGQMGDGARLLAPMPMVNMGGIGGMFTPWLEVAGTLVLHQPFDLDVFLRQLAEERIEHTVAAPSMLKLLLAKTTGDTRPWASVKTILCGSAPVDASIIRDFSLKFGVEIINSYGSNEGLTLLSGPGDPDATYERRGSLFPNWRDPKSERPRIARAFVSRLIDVDTRSEIAEPRRPGELEFKSPAVFPGYLRADGSLDRSCFTDDGFLRSAEIFEIAGEGPDRAYYHYVDRLKDVINRGGIKIPSGEIEALLQDQPEVAEAALIGMPDPILGQRIAAVVVARAGHSLDLALLNERLDERGVPKYMRLEQLFTVDALPRNPLGKILKYELVERCQPPRVDLR